MYNKVCGLATTSDGYGDDRINCFKPDGSIGARGIELLREFRGKETMKDGRNDEEEAGLSEDENNLELGGNIRINPNKKLQMSFSTLLAFSLFAVCSASTPHGRAIVWGCLAETDVSYCKTESDNIFLAEKLAVKLGLEDHIPDLLCGQCLRPLMVTG
uniref:Uncharacterized protein n=1 Tax=Globodera rostochiensis TaxID=31243 RepID=A0A914GYW1_GLORO